MLWVCFEHTLDDVPWLTLKLALVFLRQHLCTFNAYIVICRNGERLFEGLIRRIKTGQSAFYAPEHHPAFGIVGVLGQALAQLIGHGLEFFAGNLLVTANLVGKQWIDSNRCAYPKIHAE